MKWANSLPASNPPTWLGLAPNAEAALLASRGEQLLSTWQVTEGRKLHDAYYMIIPCLQIWCTAAASIHRVADMPNSDVPT